MLIIVMIDVINTFKPILFRKVVFPKEDDRESVIVLSIRSSGTA